MNSRQQTTHYPAPMQFLRGNWRSGGAGVAGVVTNPANDTVLAEVPCASRRDLDDAANAADSAFHAWRFTTGHERATILRKAAQLLRERVPALAMRMTLEQGKTLAESRMETELCADTFDWYPAEG